MDKYIIAYDIGTTSIKTCLYFLSDKIELIDSVGKEYNLIFLENGGVEQDPNEWWNAMCDTTKEILQKSNIRNNLIKAISFCAQMQGVVLVDKDINPIRNAMSYMDNRARKQMEDIMDHGFKIEGANIFKLLKSIMITKVAPLSIKDPVWKYKWVKENEPEIFTKVYKWLDVKDFLIAKSTGKCVMTKDSAYATMLLDIKNKTFSKSICKMLGVNIEHLPKIVNSTDVVGTITKQSSLELGLTEETLVFGGGGDASLIGIGAGATKLGDIHIYLGTSGWVSTVIDTPKLDIAHKIAGIVGGNDKTYNYFAEIETAGKCIEWVRDHLAYNEAMDFVNETNKNKSSEETKINLYDYMMVNIKDVPAGSNGVIFTPWLHGNRCPFENANARGIFFNIGIETGKRDLIHSVIEGVCYHLRWQLECSEKKVKTNNIIRLVGGGALAPLTCQILSDILDRNVEVVFNPQNIGSMGAAILVSVGLKIIDSIYDADSMIEVDKIYYPNKDHKKIYDTQFNVFKSLYNQNKKSFNTLNG